MLHVLASS